MLHTGYIMTDNEKRPKQTAFRLPPRTLAILDDIIKEDMARTRTDALIFVVDAYTMTRDHESRIAALERRVFGNGEEDNDKCFSKESNEG